MWPELVNLIEWHIGIALYLRVRTVNLHGHIQENLGTENLFGILDYFVWTMLIAKRTDAVSKYIIVALFVKEY